MSQVEHNGCSLHEIENRHLASKTKNLRISYPTSIPDTAELVQIPVVFNVVHLGEPVGEGTNISDQEILQGLDHLNNYYRRKYDPYDPSNASVYEDSDALDTKVEFYLADVDSTCNYSTGIRRFDGRVFEGYEEFGIPYNVGNDNSIKIPTGTHTKRFLNIWLVHEINSESGSVVGYAYYPNGYGLADFGVVCVYDNIFGVLPHEIGHILGLSHEDMSIGNFTGPHSYMIVRESANFYKNKLIGQPLNCSPANENDAAIIEVANMNEVICEGNFSPKVVIKNFGSQALSSCKIQIKNGENIISNFNWSGNLAPLQSDTVEISQINFSSGHYNLNFIVSAPNGNTDQENENDILSLDLNVAGYLTNMPTVSDFENGVPAYLNISSGNKASLSIYDTLGIDESKALVFEGKHHESVSGPLHFEAFNPFYRFKENNAAFFAYASVCIQSEPEKHYKIKYDYFSDSWSTSMLRVLANGKQTKHYIGGRKRAWLKDSTVVSSYNKDNIIVTFQSACSYAYESLEDLNYGDYIIMDNLSIEEIAPAEFEWNVLLDGPARGCVPFTRRYYNESYGAPLPVYYEYLPQKTATTYDTARTIEYPPYYRVEETGIFDLKIYAHFEDGSVDSIYIAELANTTKKPIIRELISVDEPFDWIVDSKRFDVMWEESNLGAYGHSNKSLLLNSVDQTTGYSGFETGFESLPFDFSALNKPYLTFDRSYANGSLSRAESEYLKISVSSDCGDTWEEVYNKNGGELATTEYDFDYYFNLYIPGPEEWATDTVYLPELANSDDVLIRFDFHPSFGNSLYLDNILIANEDEITGLVNINTNERFSIYPNPASHSVYLKNIENPETVSIYNSIGQLIYRTQHESVINLDQLSTGIYTIRVKAGEHYYTSSFIKK